MIIKRRKIFTVTTAASDFEKGNMKTTPPKENSSNAAAINTTSGGGPKIPPAPDITSSTGNLNSTIPMGDLTKENRLATMAANRMSRMSKTFSYQPVLGNTYVKSIQVVDDKVISPIEDLNNKLENDDVLRKSTHRFRTAVKGYIDGARLLNSKYVSKKKASRQQRGSRKGKK